MKIEDIKIEDLEIEREYPLRKVYYDKKNKKYIKIWTEDYVYKKYFDLAYISKFYEGISPLIDIITKDDNIVGYITAGGNLIGVDNFDQDKLDNLIDRVVQKCIEKEMIHIDFVSSMDNIAEVDGTYYIIDLEAVIPQAEIERFPAIQNILYFNNRTYRQKISKFIPFDNPNILCNHTEWAKDIVYGEAKGRVFLEKEYLPTLKGKVLFVGVNYYTNFYHRLILPSDSGDMETLDIDETKAKYGSPRKHHICNILDFVPQYLYDHVCMFGIMGHNEEWDIVKRDEDVHRVIYKLDSLVKRGGTLLLGPATQSVDNNYWKVIFDLPVLADGYSQILRKKIDTNCIYYGRKK